MPEILIVNNAEPGITEFTDPLAKIVSSCQAEPIIIDYHDCLTTDFSRLYGAILSGSPKGDDIVAHHAPYFQWMKEIEIPVFGICAGHHIAGFLFGAELLRSVEPESGDINVQIIKDDPLFAGIVKTMLVREMHNDSITLPEDFELLVTSDTCKNQLMKHKQKPLYTCQFHPEFNNSELIQNFITICR